MSFLSFIVAKAARVYLVTTRSQKRTFPHIMLTARHVFLVDLHCVLFVMGSRPPRLFHAVIMHCMHESCLKCCLATISGEGHKLYQAIVPEFFFEYLEKRCVHIKRKYFSSIKGESYLCTVLRHQVWKDNKPMISPGVILASFCSLRLLGRLKFHEGYVRWWEGVFLVFHCCEFKGPKYQVDN